MDLAKLLSSETQLPLLDPEVIVLSDVEDEVSTLEDCCGENGQLSRI